MTRPAPAAGPLAPLLAELFDDASLFPPASLSMTAAGEHHRAARGGPFSWMLGRFVCPVERLDEVPRGVRVSVTVGGPADVPRPGDAAAGFVAAVECRSADVDVADLGDACAAIGVDDVFVEVPPRGDAVAALAGSGVGAKLRLGGPDASSVPAAVAVADAITAAATEGVRWKATAGLHHPFRRRDPTGQFMMHGFFNVLAATAAAMAGAGGPTVVDVLEEPDPGSFLIADDRFGWGQWTVDARGAARLRAEGLTAIGSCSFSEPVDDLVALGVIS